MRDKSLAPHVSPQLSRKARILQVFKKIYFKQFPRQIRRKQNSDESRCQRREVETTMALGTPIGSPSSNCSKILIDGLPNMNTSPIIRGEEETTSINGDTSVIRNNHNTISETAQISSGEESLVQETINSLTVKSPALHHVYDYSTQEISDIPGSKGPKKFDFWGKIPYEIALSIFRNLTPKEIVRVSAVSKGFNKLCYDGQLWTSFDATKFYRKISAESLTKILVTAGPFVKDLNLRGCIQVEHYKRAEAVVKACRNLTHATLEGCRNFQHSTLHVLLLGNANLVSLNFTGLAAVTNITCQIIAQNCPCLETLDISWCSRMDARGIRIVVQKCAKLKDLRAGEIKGLDCLDLAQDLFETNNLERLVLCGCTDLTDQALQIMMHGRNPEIDILTKVAQVPIRRLHYLDISCCSRITNSGIGALAHLTCNLRGLLLNCCSRISDEGLSSVISTTPNLTHLELEEVSNLSDGFFKDVLAKASCATSLKHLSVSYCENIGDDGMIPIFRTCKNLQRVDMDNTNITDLVLNEAATMVRSRCELTSCQMIRPIISLHLVVYDCQNITWIGIREVMSRNAEVQKSSEDEQPLSAHLIELISLKCYFCWQMTVDEHTRRLLRGDHQAACKLERLWAEWMMANEETGALSPGTRRRRRRRRITTGPRINHANEERNNRAVEALDGNRETHSRIWVTSCSVM
ncbi:F-box/LRR-repeat protein 2 [Golovinomyces cichoracearum]|uniref:F-box/LRR-repeat protein 2 n=1 Tax=Golovinomyces cichoracearum TaxID=62708 RepID=A0A420HL29_9PEZI|nr:F-box/LRR-repeat protein 2 [Golovinomyces cichoracearum]